MIQSSAATADAILRSNFDIFLERCFGTLNPGTPFQPNWHLDALAYNLKRVRQGETQRLMINMPPRHLKSLTVSVAFPAFLLGLEPWRRIFVISYGAELSDKHSADFRTIVESLWYRRAFPKMRIVRSVGDEVTTSLRGFRKSTSVAGTLTGLGGDIFILDDPQKPADAQSKTKRASLNQWVSNTLMSRLDNKEKGAIIVVMQRLHMDDICGHLLDGPETWRWISLPALAEEPEGVKIGPGECDMHYRKAGDALHPERESAETLRVLRETVGADVFAAQYQQDPVPEGGAMIKRDWLRYYKRAPERASGMKVIQSWDTAAKGGAQNSWSVCTTWLLDKGNYYLLDLARGRYNYPDLKDVAEDLADRYEPNVILIEDASTGMALAPEIEKLCSARVELVRPEADKEGRLYVNQAKFERGLVHFPEGASFLPALEDELLAFPHGAADDQVDSITQALSHKITSYDGDIISANMSKLLHGIASRPY